MKRQRLPILVVLGSLAAVVTMVLLFSLETATNRAEAAFDEETLAAFAAGTRSASEAPESDVRAHRAAAAWQPNDRWINAYPPYPYPIESIFLHANYAYDVVEGNAEQAGVVVTVTVTAFDDSPKASAVVATESNGYFAVDCPDWSTGECPDIVPGDKVLAVAQDVTAAINPVGHISGQLDEATNVVSGTLLAPGETGQLNVTCQVLTDPGSPAVHKTADASGGNFSCDLLSEAGWDLHWGDQVALSYEEGDGDLVTNVVPWSWARVNYGHDQAGMNYDLGRTFWLTVTDSSGAVKGTAEATTTSGGGWGGPGFQTEPGQWAPGQPDIAPGDWVHFAADDGYRNSVQVGTITAILDADADRLAGQVLVSGFGVSLTVECHPWGAWDLGIDAPIKESWAATNGSVPFACQWEAAEWDVQIGQEAAAMYLEPDWDRVINVFEGIVPSPELRIAKAVEGSQLAGSVVTYTLTVSNVGTMAASSLVISDHLPSNLTWTSGGSYDAGSQDITWTWPGLAIGQSAGVQFSGELACTGQVVNDQYLVASSDQGIGSPSGPAVAFSIISPTIQAGFTHSTDPVAGAVTQFQAEASTDGPTPLSYAWDFGDGHSGNGPTPGHVYAADGQYTVILTATDACGYQASHTAQVDVEPPTLTADFVQSHMVVAIHSAVHFTDTSSTNGAAIAAWLWDFGDGSPDSTLQNPSHIYHEWGTYTVTLVVTDVLGYEDQIVRPDAVRTQAPMLEIGKAVEGNRVAGTVVTYTLTVSNVGEVIASGLVITDQLPANVTWISGGAYDSGSGIITWQWPSLAAGHTATVQFSGRLGCSGQVINERYRVAESDQGASSPWGDALSFSIVPPTVTAGFGQSTSEARPGETVFFTSSSTTNGSPLTTFSWDFDDGQNGSGATVGHAFARTGEYQVTLTTADACGFQDTASGTVEVSYMLLLPIIYRE